MKALAPPKPKDQWHQLQSEIRWSNMRASDKAVFRCLLDKAQFDTAELLTQWTPDREKIRKETSLSKRQVRYSIRHLERHRWVKTAGSTGPGKRLAYTLSIGDRCDCTGRVHAPATGATGDGAGDSQRGQPETVTGATFGHRSGATNGGNAAGQNARQNRGITEEEEEDVTGRDVISGAARDHVTSGDVAQVTVKIACARHQTVWGAHPHCPDCNALNWQVWD